MFLAWYEIRDVYFNVIVQVYGFQLQEVTRMHCDSGQLESFRGNSRIVD